MILIVNKGKMEVLPSKPCPRNRRRFGPLAIALTPIARPNRLRQLVGGPLTLPEFFPALALIFMVGYLISCILGNQALPSISVGIGVTSSAMPRLQTVAAFVAAGLFIYLTVALLRPKKFS